MTWPLVAFWVLLAYGLASRSPFLIYFFFAAGAFGSLAVIPVEAVGGVNLLPQSVCAAFLVLRVLIQPASLKRAVGLLAQPGELGILLAFFAVSVVATAFMPRVFAGTVSVITISGALDGLQSLAPGFFNVTQMAYMALSVGTVVAFALLAERPGLERILVRGIVAGGVVLGVTGFVALAADAAGVSDWLAPFRTVSYTLMIDAQVLGVRRLVGLMPEASAFGASCCVWGVALTFLAPCAEGLERVVAVTAAAALFALAAFSTSSTAFVGLAAWLVLVAVGWCRRFVYRLPGWTLDRRVLVLTAGGLALLAFVALNPQAPASAADMIDAVLFRKAESSSYAERMQWNRVALDAMVATGGLGVGLGSARSSNWFVAVVSNTGLLGAVLMAAFLLQTFGRRPPAREPVLADMMVAFKATAVMNLVLAALAATSPDFGVSSGAVYGILTGLALRGRANRDGLLLGPHVLPQTRLGPATARRRSVPLPRQASLKGYDP